MEWFSGVGGVVVVELLVCWGLCGSCWGFDGLGGGFDLWRGVD